MVCGLRHTSDSETGTEILVKPEFYPLLGFDIVNVGKRERENDCFGVKRNPTDTPQDFSKMYKIGQNLDLTDIR